MTMTEQTINALTEVLQKSEFEKGRINQEDKQIALKIKYDEALDIIKRHFDFCAE